jgi:hypothetical protein
MSVSAPIKDTTLNLAALALWVGVAVLAIIVVLAVILIVGALFSGRH